MSELGEHDRNEGTIPGCDCRSCAIKQRDALLSACKQTLDENSHLADGDNCTLILLKRALAEIGQPWAEYPIITCPQCGDETEDMDGFGFLYCDKCKFCTHPSWSGVEGDMRCDTCGEKGNG